MGSQWSLLDVNSGLEGAWSVLGAMALGSFALGFAWLVYSALVRLELKDSMLGFWPTGLLRLEGSPFYAVELFGRNKQRQCPCPYADHAHALSGSKAE